MPKIQLNKFDGGQAEDIRTFATDQNEVSKNFDLFTNPHKLLPYRDSVTDTVSSGTLTDFELNGIVFDGTLYWTVGRTSSGSAVPKFFSKTNLQDNWQAGNVGAAGSTIINGTLVLYKGLAYVLAYNSSNQLMIIDSGGTTRFTSAVGNAPQTYAAKPFVHPEDNVLYAAYGKVIAKWDGSSSSEVTTILPTDASVPSITDYGSYLAIACITAGKSVAYLWGRDTTINTLQGTIPFGETTLLILENIGNELVGICISSSSLAVSAVGSIDVKVYSGGDVITVRSLTMATAIVNAKNYKTKYQGGLYFGFGSDDALYVVRKNKEGFWAISKDRYFINGTTILSGTPIPAILNGFLWTSFGSSAVTGRFYRTSGVPTESETYASTSVHRTTINPNMPAGDRGKKKPLKAVRIFYTGKTNGTIGVKYLVDGKNSSNTTTFESVISESTTAKEDFKEATQIADNQAFAEGIEFQFQIECTGGVEPKFLEYEY